MSSMMWISNEQMEEERLLEQNREALEAQKMAQIEATVRYMQKYIRIDEMTKEEVMDIIGLFPTWFPNMSYNVGDRIQYSGKLYEVLQAHTSQADWTPDAVPALYRDWFPEEVIREWVRPTGAHDAYNIGDKVLFEGLIYESTINGNTWSPTEYPAGWILIEN